MILTIISTLAILILCGYWKKKPRITLKKEEKFPEDNNYDL